MRFAPAFSTGRRLPDRESDAERPRSTPLVPGPILLATDGGSSADGAVAVAAQLALSRRADFRVLTVVEPVATRAIAGTIGPAARQPWSGETYAAEQRRAVLRQLARCGGQLAAVELEAAAGSPAAAIAAAAAQCEPALIILGIRPHSLLDRVFRDETTLGVMRRASRPVLGVTPLAAELPRRAVVGVDFSLSSLHAARAVLPLLADGATVYLVHVEPRPREWDGGAGDDALLTTALPAGFTRFRHLLCPPEGTRIEQVVLEGDNFGELDHFAGRVGAQLVALGSIRRDDPRPRGGRLREAFVRAAGISVLVGPPAARAGIMED